MVCELCLNKLWKEGREGTRKGGREGEKKQKENEEHQTQTSIFPDFLK